MIKLYLIRHGIAAPKEDYAKDEARPLTAQGIEKTAKVAKRLRERGLHFDLILTSPLVRAKATASILQDAGLASQVEEFPALAPDGDIDAWVRWLEKRRQTHGDDKRLALVGHQPDLGNWAEILVWGEAQEKLVLKKAGIIGLKSPKSQSPIGQGELFLLTSPKWLL
jgi:phosphohistidine phosphatase